MAKFRRQFDPRYKGALGEPASDKPSMTVPDQNITLKELIKNHVRGIPSSVAVLKGQYFGTDIPVLDDLNDLQEYREILEQKKQEISQELQAISDKATEEAKKRQDEKNPVLDKHSGPDGNPNLDMD